MRQAAYECLVAIGSTYYERMTNEYVNEIFNLTCKAAREDEEAVALQAIEFWSTIAEEELELLVRGEPPLQVRV